MRDKKSKLLSNQLEFTLLGESSNEYDISRSPSPKHFPMVKDDIPSEILNERSSSSSPCSLGSDSRLKGNSVGESSNPDSSEENSTSVGVGIGICNDEPEPSSSLQLLVDMKENFAEREDFEESILLKDLKAIREEVWARKRAKKIQQRMKKVQFKDEQQQLPFSRACCAHKKFNSDGETTTNTNTTTIDKEKATFSGQLSPNGNEKRSPVILHSINMFQNIIPRNMLKLNKI